MSQAVFGPITQIGYVVDDLDHAVGGWVKQLGVGPWTIFRNVRMEGTYLGAPTSVMMDVALGYQGDVQIELIEPTNDARSPYRGDDGRVIAGMHHLAWIVDDLDAGEARLTTRGLTTRFAAANDASRVVYMGADSAPGVLYELIESPATAEYIAQGIAATQAWDGNDPILAEIDFAAI